VFVTTAMITVEIVHTKMRRVERVKNIVTISNKMFTGMSKALNNYHKWLCLYFCKITHGGKHTF
jgi:hypothetical protein